MVVEHDFVTTLDADECLRIASDLLIEEGYSIEPDPSGTAFGFRRGGKAAKVTTRIDRLPQAGRLAYDRGRVTLAASIRPRAKAKDLHRDVLLDLATGLERRLADAEPLERILADRAPLAKRIISAHRKVVALQVVGWSILLSPFVLLGGWAAYQAMFGRR
ncbi:MAG: hypothetical protein R3B68_14240 [Phycisphaerales bacterium]